MGHVGRYWSQVFQAGGALREHGLGLKVADRAEDNMKEHCPRMLLGDRSVCICAAQSSSNQPQVSVEH